ncbi:MAG: hypothetical protein KU37_06920 [Sulfuricurvum sp. PC08-66]|nr:MAG: hypothetical protein KU37_06920 [Sulfuricurvum sp. PC08-66]
MRIAVPLDEHHNLYANNPNTANFFAIYRLEGTASHLTYRLEKTLVNPWYGPKCGEFDDEQRGCTCDIERQKNMRHISEHYAMLQVIGECSYLLAGNFCDTLEKALGMADVAIYPIPPVVKNIDNAIANFIIGARLASQVHYIHQAS